MAANPKSRGKLEDQAATAALYVTRSTTSAGTGSTYLDESGKLSSAGAATSLKYAQPADLPSFPSQGGVKLSSAGAAASLAHANQRTFEHWKAGEIPAANKAAFLAKDYQAPPLWQPEMSSAGSKAALIAAREGGNVSIWRPSETEDGQNAAGHAMRNTDLSPNVFRGVTAEGGYKAKLAATGAMSSNRRRAESSPAYPYNTPPNTIRAGAPSQGVTQRGQDPIGVTDTAIDHARIHNVAKGNVNRQMYTANPPVAIEVEEKNRKDTLHASAVAMAKQMYKIQQARIDEAAAAAAVSRSDSHYAANKVHARRESTASTSTTDDLPSPPLYTNLQEAAQKLATERLAKLHDEHQAYRNYYGATSPPRKRLSMRPKPRRRASSDSDAAKIDQEQSQKIRSEMSLFQDKLAAIDAKTRQKDRDNLMAAAQRNVAARMSTMDDKVFEDTGKASPAMVAEWEAAAQARAKADSDARMVNHGKIHIGSGKYLDQAEVDAIARSRLQPTLDDITEKAEQQRARDEEMRLEEEEKRRQAEAEKARIADLKAEQKKAKDAEKAEEKARKDFEKSQLAEEKRIQREKEAEEKRIQKEKDTEEKRIQREKDAEEKRVQREKDAEEKRVRTEREQKEKEEKRQSKEAAAKETPEANKRKGGFFGAFGLGTGIGAGASAGAAGAGLTAAVPLTLDTAPKAEPVSPGEGETTDKEVAPEDAEPKTKEEAAEDPFEDPNEGLYEDADDGTAKDATKAETAKEEPTSPAGPTEETSSSPPLPIITTTGAHDSATSPTNEEPPVSPTKSGVKGWLKGKFARRSSRAAKDEPGFIGGAALAGTGSKDDDEGPPALVAEEDSMKEVAMAGKSSLGVDAPDAALYSASEYEEDAGGTAAPAEETKGAKKSPSISSMSSAGAPDTTKDRVSPIDVSEPSSPLQSPVSPTSPESPTSPLSPTKSRGRERITGFLSKGKGLGRKLSKRQKSETTPASVPYDSTKEASAPESGPSAPAAETTAEGAEPAVECGGGETMNKEFSEALEKKIAEESGPDATKTKGKAEEERGESEEARDTFDTSNELAPPPKLTDVISNGGAGLGRKVSGSPVRDSRFSEDL